MDNKLEFARRLRDGMVAAGLEARPGVLLNLFNTQLGTFRYISGSAALAQGRGGAGAGQADGAGLFSAAADPVPQAEPPVAEAQTAEPEPIESPSRTGWVDRLVEYAARAQPLAVYFIGVGEQLQYLQTFQAREFAQALVS